jgi:hypothetical protein
MELCSSYQYSLGPMNLHVKVVHRNLFTVAIIKKTDTTQNMKIKLSPEPSVSLVCGAGCQCAA